jgi:hypothetical protein
VKGRLIVAHRRFAGDSRRDDDDRDGRWDDPALRTLFDCAQALIGALRVGAGETELVPLVRAYVQCATAQGVSSARIRDLLEFLTQEHAPARGRTSRGSFIAGADVRGSGDRNRRGR